MVAVSSLWYASTQCHVHTHTSSFLQVLQVVCRITTSSLDPLPSLAHAFPSYLAALMQHCLFGLQTLKDEQFSSTRNYTLGDQETLLYDSVPLNAQTTAG
jgi:hypothetical protein